MKHFILAALSAFVAFNASAETQVTSFAPAAPGKLTRTILENEKKVCYTVVTTNRTAQLDCVPYAAFEGQQQIQKELADLPYGKVTVIKDPDFNVTCVAIALENADLHCTIPLRALMSRQRKVQ